MPHLEKKIKIHDLELGKYKMCINTIIGNIIIHLAYTEELILISQLETENGL